MISDKKEQIIDTHSIDEAQKYAEWKEADAKMHTVCDFTYTKF